MTYSRLCSTALLMGLLCMAMPFADSRAATYTAQEQANMKLVTDFYAELDAAGPVLKQKIRGIAERYLKPDYIQHMDQQGPFGPGREGLIQMLEQMPATPAPTAGTQQAGAPGAEATPAGGPPVGAMPSAKLLVLAARGDLVVQVTSRTMPDGKGTYIFNMFRVQDGKFAEHWDAHSDAAPDAGKMGRTPGAPSSSAKP